MDKRKTEAEQREGNRITSGMSIRILFLTGLLFCSFISKAQVVANSLGSSTWNNPANWSCNCVPNTANSTVTIKAGHTVTVSITPGSAVDEVVVEAGATLAINAGIVLTIANGTGPDLINTGTVTTTAATSLVFQNGAEYQHNQSGNAIPRSTWSTNSTCKISGWVSAATTPQNNFRASLNQTFYNFTWDSPGQTQAAMFLNGLLTTVNGDLTISNTGTSSIANTRLILGLNAAPTTTASMTVKGNFLVNGNSQVALNSSGAFTMTVEGDVVLSSDNAGTSAGATPYIINTLNGTSTLNIFGDLTITKGVLDLVSNNVTTVGSINLGGDFNFVGGQLWKSAGVGNFSFYNGGTHNYSLTAGVFPAGQSINYSVAGSNTLDVATFALGNAASTFTANGTLVVKSVSPSGALADNIPATTRTFNSGSVLTYGSTFPQFMGAENPSASTSNTIINNSNGVTLASSAQVGNLILTAGNLGVSSNTLTINGNVTANANAIVVTSNSSLAIGGSGAFGVLPISGSTIDNFTISRTAGSLSLGQDLTVQGTMLQVEGTLNLNNHILTVESDYIGLGDVSSPASSSLLLTNTGALPDEIFFSGIFDTITLDRAGETLTTTSTFEVLNLNLLDGAFSNATGTSISDHGKITVRNGTLATAPTSVGTYDVEYINPVTPVSTGGELASGAIRHLDISGGGAVTLTTDVVATGNITLSDGTFNAGANQISLGGNLVLNDVSTFSSSTLAFDGTSTISGTTIPAFNNLSVAAGASLNTPSAMTLSGDLNIDATATINTSTTDYTFTGGALQNVDGGGKTFRNITLNKSPATTLQLSGSVVLTGLLSITSSNTTFNSNGFLRLTSTSDGTTGNASIGPLLNGATVTGDVIAERYMGSEGRIYRYISSPVTNATVAQLQQHFPITGVFPQASTCSGCITNSPSFYYYNEVTGQYVNYPTTSSAALLEPGRGYAAFIRQNILPGAVTWSVTGPVNQGEITLPVAHNASPSGSYSLVGNPFPSSIDWDIAGWTKTNIDNSIAIRDNGQGTHIYWNGSSGNIPNGIIAAGQAFWVQTAASPSLKVNENAKVTTTGSFFKVKEPDVMVMRIAKGSLKDETFFQIHEQSSTDRDAFDALKLANDFLDLGTRFDAQNFFAINAVDRIDCSKPLTLAMRFTKTAQGAFVVAPQGDYTLQFETQGTRLAEYDITLTDQFTGNAMPVGSGLSYNFSITTTASSYAEDRFKLTFTEKKPMLNVAMRGDATVCGNGAVNITVDDTQAYKNYSLEVNGLSVSNATPGNGGSLVFPVKGADLVAGKNTIIASITGSCGVYKSTTSFDLIKEDATGLKLTPGKICGPGIVQLEASGASTSATYAWYSRPEAQTPAATGSQYGPELEESATFYASVVFPSGCVSEKVAVTAEVINLDVPVITVLEADVLKSNYDVGNQWYFQDGPIPGATSQTYRPRKSGMYTLEVSAKGCKASTKLEYVVTDLERSSVATDVYPNPVKDILYVVKEADAEILFSNAAGASVEVLQIRTNDGIAVDMRGFTPGMYYLRVQSGKKQRVFKIIKQ